MPFLTFCAIVMIMAAGVSTIPAVSILLLMAGIGAVILSVMLDTL